MEMCLGLVYDLGHETMWQSPAVGGTSPPCHSAGEKRQKPGYSRTAARSFSEFGVPLVAELPTGWLGRTETAADPGTSAEALRVPEAGAAWPAAERPAGASAFAPEGPYRLRFYLCSAGSQWLAVVQLLRSVARLRLGHAVLPGTRTGIPDIAPDLIP